MKIKRAFLEYDDCAGDGWVVSGKYHTESGFLFWKTLKKAITKNWQWGRFVNKRKST
jgi:hypothetical protein